MELSYEASKQGRYILSMWISEFFEKGGKALFSSQLDLFRENIDENKGRMFSRVRPCYE